MTPGKETTDRPGETEKRQGVRDSVERQAPGGNSWERLGLHRMNGNSMGSFKSRRAKTKAKPKHSRLRLDNSFPSIIALCEIRTQASIQVNSPRDLNRETDPNQGTK